nr:MAG TPA: hypothetical protein [Caudoviricetes sp.]
MAILSYRYSTSLESLGRVSSFIIPSVNLVTLKRL